LNKFTQTASNYVDGNAKRQQDNPLKFTTNGNSNRKATINAQKKIRERRRRRVECGVVGEESVAKCSK